MKHRDIFFFLLNLKQSCNFHSFIFLLLLPLAQINLKVDTAKEITKWDLPVPQDSCRDRLQLYIDSPSLGIESLQKDIYSPSVLIYVRGMTFLYKTWSRNIIGNICNDFTYWKHIYFHYTLIRAEITYDNILLSLEYYDAKGLWVLGDTNLLIIK